MHRIYYLIVFTACLWIFIDCQGDGRGVTELGDAHTSDVLRRVSGFFALVSIICVLIFIYCVCFRGRPAKDNATFVSADSVQEEQELGEMESLAVANVFQSGIWTGRYLQYGRWHGPHEMSLRFDPHSTIISGWGSDDVGKFTVKGIYSHQTRRIGLTKTYQPGADKKTQHLGHDAEIQLTETVRQTSTQLFEGKWYVQTLQYHGEDKFQLSFDRNCECEEV